MKKANGMGQLRLAHALRQQFKKSENTLANINRMLDVIGIEVDLFDAIFSFDYRIMLSEQVQACLLSQA